MKLTTPKTADQYFAKTEHAVKHAYAGLESCWAYYQDAMQYLTPGKLGDDGMIHYLSPSTPEESARLDRYLELAGKYFELKISEAMFAGDILQAAYMAIRLFSRNTAIPASCASFVKPASGLRADQSHPPKDRAFLADKAARFRWCARWPRRKQGAAVELAAERSCQPRVILETRSESLNRRSRRPTPEV